MKQLKKVLGREKNLSFNRKEKQLKELKAKEFGVKIMLEHENV